jgi:uncharacterized surface anchored protein
MKTASILLVAWLGLTHAIAAQTSIAGKVTNEEGHAVLNAKITLYKNGIYVMKAYTDSSGNYSFSNIDPGTYRIVAKAENTGYCPIQGVVAQAGKFTKLDIGLPKPSYNL